jgi:hypothetical protein
MPNYLLTKDWKTILDKKEHKSVKKTGISDLLDDYANALKKDDLEKIADALTAITVKAGQVKTAQRIYPIMFHYLDDMIKEAKAKKILIDKRLDDEGAGPFAKELKLIKQVTADKPWHFVFAPGKTAGFVVSKLPLKKDDIEAAHKMRGQKGVYHSGDIYFDQGKYILSIEARPPSGIAKGAVNAAKLHAKMKIGVIVMGGGISIDSDNDLDPDAEGPGLGAGQTQQQDQTSAQAHDQRIMQLTNAVLKAGQMPGGTREGALDGLISTAERLREQITSDTTLDTQTRTQLTGRLDQIRRDIQQVTNSGTPNPLAKYVTLEQWRQQTDAINKLDPSKHNDGWERMMKQHQDMSDLRDRDTELSDKDRQTVSEVLRRALEMISAFRKQAERLQDANTEKGDPALTKKFLALERKMETIARSGLATEEVEKVAKVFDLLRREFRLSNFDGVARMIDRVDAAAEKVLKSALVDIQKTTARQDQAEMHRTLAPSMELIKKAAFTPGMIKDQASLREAMKQDPLLVQMIQSGAAVTRKLDGPNIVQLEDSARKVIDAVASRKPVLRELNFGDDGYDENNPALQFAPPDPNDPVPLPGDAESVRLAEDILKRANMAKLVLQYETLGPPPWDEGKTDLASELQTQLFFLESAIASGSPNYKAPSTAEDGSGGASGSWWIERTESNPKDRNAPKGNKTYIFKPGSGEARTFAGLPPGSGAPREVLAKKLDDIMSGAGFQVGVSPTTLASIDSTQLGRNEELTGVQLGSMQRLAPTDGTVDKNVKTGLVVDKQSFDNVAVFDMIFANLDRHGGNVLVNKDPATGKSTLVPIDHGSSLPDPDALQGSRASLIPPNNVMADPERLPQCLEPLSDEALESLARLDPDTMAQEMKRQRNDMANRHPETTGMISDAAIDAMAARVRFIKAVGNSVPVKDLFDMLAFGAARIATCKPEDIAQLVIDLKAESAKRAKTRPVVDELVDYYFSTESNAGSALWNRLTDLGWGWSVDQKVIRQWAEDNSTLVANILKTNKVCVATQREVARMLPLVRNEDPQIDTKIASLSLGSQAKTLFDALNKPLLDPIKATDMKIEAVMQEIIRLGGDATFAKVLEVLPASAPKSPKPGPKPDPRDVFTYEAERLSILRVWAEINRMGGMAEYLRLGGEFYRELTVKSMIPPFAELKATEQDRRDVEAMDPDEVDEAMDTTYETLEDDVERLLLVLRDPTHKREASALLLEGQTAWGKGDKTTAINILGRNRLKMKDREKLQIQWIADTTRKQQDFAVKLGNEDPLIRQAYEADRQRIEKAMADAVLVYDTAGFNKALQEGEARLDVARLGAEAPLNKAIAAFAPYAARLNGHVGQLWHPDLKNAYDAVETNLTGFYLSTFFTDIPRLKDRFDVADKLADALGDRQVSSLDQDLQKKLADWGTNIRTNSSLNKIDAFIKEFKGKLENV